MIDKAIAFATKAHEGQLRKGTNLPYILHPMEVGMIVSRMTDDNEVIAAAVLHDTVEDCDGVSLEMIREEFGEKVARIVTAESEDKAKSWMERKAHTIDFLKNETMKHLQIWFPNQNHKILPQILKKKPYHKLPLKVSDLHLFPYNKYLNVFHHKLYGLYLHHIV